MIRGYVDKTEIYSQISKETGIDIKMVKEICEHQSRQLSLHMVNLKDEDFKLPLIGKVIQKHKPPNENILDDFDF